ncbi:MAG: hypothetical protein FJY88_07050 [Candidatus Eisenbacteria bacterium]|nr:hypothetical protein [Candidatus Eisenbacteria bacterium]
MRPGGRPFPLRLFPVALLFLLAACQKDPTPPAQQPPLDFNAEIQRGWSLYRNHQYAEAEATFRGLVEGFPHESEPLVGRGWCEVETDSLDLAIRLFQTAIEMEALPDAFAGIAVTASALGRDSLAVAAAHEITDPSYLFIGDPYLGYQRIVYLRALGEFHLRRWQDCYDSLLILRSWLEIDLDDYDFREQLMAALESLRGTG